MRPDTHKRQAQEIYDLLTQAMMDYMGKQDTPSANAMVGACTAVLAQVIGTCPADKRAEIIKDCIDFIKVESDGSHTYGNCLRMA